MEQTLWMNRIRSRKNEPVWLISATGGWLGDPDATSNNFWYYGLDGHRRHIFVQGKLKEFLILLSHHPVYTFSHELTLGAYVFRLRRMGIEIKTVFKGGSETNQYELLGSISEAPELEPTAVCKPWMRSGL